ncbi:MAG: hypothetical protein H6834_18175 [Planctomycetes bacterium]|nr:hypothetical protein [Planctomycetota bacterium]MCB9891515.1 hypothetical protein [Planctomycetota bacterium]
MRNTVRHLLAAGFGSFLLTTTLPARVWVVDDDPGPGVDFQQVQDAVLAASSGDTILVRDGVYAAISVEGKGLTIVGASGAPSIADAWFGSAVRHVPQGETVLIRGLRFSPGLLSSQNLSLEENRGRIVLEDLTLTPASGTAPATIALWTFRCDEVVLARCRIEAAITSGAYGKEGLYAFLSNVHAYDTTFVGGRGTDGIAPLQGALPGGEGATIRSGTFFASGCSFAGGDGGDGGNVCLASGRGGHGLFLSRDSMGGARVHVLGCRFTAGRGGAAPSAPGCTQGSAPDGQPTVVEEGTLQVLPGMARSLATNAPVRHGSGSLVETFVGEPGDAVVLAVSPAAGTALFDPFLFGSLHLALPVLFTPKGTLGSAPLVSSVPIPNLGVDAIVLPMQMVVLSPRLEVRLGSPSWPVFVR